MSYAGQFETGRSLCVGIKLSVLGMKPYHLVTVGNTIYKVDCEKALELVKQNKAYFKDDVGIVPILLCSEVIDIL